MGATQPWREPDLIDFQVRNSLASILGYPPTGKVIYVHSGSGLSTNSGLSSAAPLTTLALALANASDSVGDVVYLMPGHAETLATTTAGITISKSGISIIGGGNARNRPALTCGAGDVVGVLVSGSNNLIRNIRFVGSASQTSKASSLFSITGTDNIIEGNVIEHGSTGCADAIKCTAADRTVIRGNTFLGIGTACQVAIQVKSNLLNGVIDSNTFNYGINQLQSAVLFASVGSNVSGMHMTNNICSGIKLKFLNCVGSIATNTTAGICTGNRIAYSATLTLLASTTITPGDLGVMDQHEVDGKRISPVIYGTVSTHPNSTIQAHATIMHT